MFTMVEADDSGTATSLFLSIESTRLIKDFLVAKLGRRLRVLHGAGIGRR
jgi:hypothetical protein